MSKLTIIMACLLALASSVFAKDAWRASDGWHRFLVPAVAPAPKACCYRLTNSSTRPSVCQLDRRNHGFIGSMDGAAGLVEPEVAQSAVGLKVDEAFALYVKTHAGKTIDLQSYSASCPVQAEQTIRDQGGLSVADALTLLEPTLQEEKLAEASVIALAWVRGDAAAQRLIKVARSDGKQQRDALFWLGQTRGALGAQALIAALQTERSENLREHIAFSLSQSADPSAAPALLMAAEKDPSESVRGHVWFSLSQMSLPGLEQKLRARVDRESAVVQEQMVFALSQLPEPKASQALIAWVTDQQLDKSVRRRALFWLAQSEEPAALAYLQQVLQGAKR
jgi:HEAT repeat protein